MVSVEPTYSYYEKVSEELERIVLEVQEKEEVQPLSDGEKHCSESYLHFWLENSEYGITLVSLQENGSASYLCDKSQSRVIPMKKEFEVWQDFIPAVQQPAHVFSWLFLFSLEEVINRIIALTKAQGDAIDEKVGVLAGLFVGTYTPRKMFLFAGDTVFFR